MNKPKKKVTDAVEILRQRYVGGNPEMARLLEEERANLRIAAQLRDLREKAGLSQRDLATLIGTTASVICRLEDADYEGHSLTMLRRIAAAFNRRVDVRFLPVQEKSGKNKTLRRSRPASA